MKQIDLIMLNMSNFSEWEGGVSNRNYHVLKQLLNRPEIGKILAVDYLPITFKRVIRNYKEDLVLNLKDGQVIKRGLTYKISKVSDKLYVYSDINFFLRPKSTMKRIKKTAMSLNFGDLVLWSFFPLAAPYWDILGQKLTVFEAVDNWSLHSSYSTKVERLKKCYEQIKNSADLIFVVSKNLVDFFEDQPNVHWIPNGVDFNHYNKKFPLVNRDIADLPRPIVGYIGVIQNKVDLELIKYLADKNPDKSFALVGPVWNEQDKSTAIFVSNKNVYLLGYKKYEEAPMYIQQFDVGIIPHRKSGFSASTNPMKMYEYLACGKPVVATDNVGTDNVNDMIVLAKDHEDFNQKINQALETDTDDQRKKRQEFVKKHSWFNTVSRMLELINNKLD